MIRLPPSAPRPDTLLPSTTLFRSCFVGYTPNLVAGVYVGFDTPVTLGRGGTGSSLAAPIFADFMEEAVKRTPPEKFHVPDGMQFIPVNRKTGMTAFEGDPDTIVEAFKPGTGPADVFTVIGEGEYLPPEQILEASPPAQQAVTSGAAGLFSGKTRERSISRPRLRALPLRPAQTCPPRPIPQAKANED